MEDWTREKCMEGGNSRLNGIWTEKKSVEGSGDEGSRRTRKRYKIQPGELCPTCKYFLDDENLKAKVVPQLCIYQKFNEVTIHTLPHLKCIRLVTVR